MDTLKIIGFAVASTVVIGLLFASFVTIGLAALGFAVVATLSLITFQYVQRLRHKRNMTSKAYAVYQPADTK